MHLYKNTKLFTTILFVLFGSIFLHAQESDKNLEKAKVAYNVNRFEEAVTLAKEVLKTDPENADANYICGLGTFKSGHKAASLPYFKKTYQLNEHHDKFLLKHLARVYQLNYQFDTAIAMFQEYETHLHKHEKHDQILEKELIDKRIAECLSAKELMKHPKKVNITHFGSEINSKYDDYSPIVSADETVLIFTSRRDHEEGNNFSKKDFAFYEEVFIAKKNSDGTWSQAKSLGDNVNGRRHDACVAISPDGDRLIVYKSNPRTKGDLYYSDLKNGVWSEPEKFNGDINSSHFEPSATLNSKEDWMIFSSDRQGGYGGLDLYMSRLQSNGEWGTAVNLGPIINTRYNEDAPYLQNDQKTLHFSSDGHNSMGGYDVFTTIYDPQANTWSVPENVGYPINTPNDDIYFSWNKDGNRAYFSSVRENGMGGQDLYTLEYIKPIPKVILKGIVTNKITQQPIASSIKVYNPSDSNKFLGTINSDSTTGKFLLSLPYSKVYEIQVQANGYFPYSENNKTSEGTDSIEINKKFELESIHKDDKEQKRKLALKNLLFDYNKSDLVLIPEEQLKAVVDFMNENRGVRLEISGHADSIGSHAYNQRLSDSRALTVKNRLEQLGVQQERLTSKGYSFDKPIATNKTPEGRQMNRRTEFLVLEDKK